jgi:hypothetical protein
MDPETCIKRAHEAVADNDMVEAVAAFTDYLEWRNKGGYAPLNGDIDMMFLAGRIIYKLA